MCNSTFRHPEAIRPKDLTGKVPGTFTSITAVIARSPEGATWQSQREKPRLLRLRLAMTSVYLASELHKFLETQFCVCTFFKKGILASLILLSLSPPNLQLHPALAADSEASSNPQYGGTFHLGTHQKPAPFDVFKAIDTISAPLMDIIFNKLVRYSERGVFEPDLAERWAISEDGLTYTFYLRKGIKFHDGNECTAQDVLKTYELISDKDVSPSFYHYFNAVKKFSAPSDYVFKVSLKEPYTPFLLSLWRAKILPQHRFKNLKKDVNAFSQHPIGTGPFQFVTQEPSGRMLFRAFEDYFEGRPYLDEVIVEIFPNKGQVWSAFLRGEIDMAFQLDRQDYMEIKDNPSFKIFRSLYSSGYALMFNMRDEVLSDLKIRKAVAYGIDRKEIVGRFEEGRGVVPTGPFHPQSWAYNPEVRPDPYDPQAALSLLKEAGFVLKEGIQEREGKKLFINLFVDPENAHLVRMAKSIRQQLQEIGIGIKFQYFKDHSELSKLVYDPSSKFQTYLFIFNNNLPDAEVLSMYWEGSGAYNWGSYQNSEVDHLFQTARNTNEHAQRAKAYHQIHRIIAREKPAVFLYIPYVYHAVAEKIEQAENLFGPFFISLRRLTEVHKQEERR